MDLLPENLVDLVLTQNPVVLLLGNPSFDLETRRYCFYAENILLRETNFDP